MIKVMCFGAFDGLHPGHLNFLRQAKKQGDFLIVSVGTDKNVQAIKQQKTLFDQKERLALVQSLKFVDKAILGVEKKFFEEIAKYAPQVICLGYDQWAREEDVRAQLDRVGLKKTKVIRLKPHKQERAKSTIMKEKSVDY